VCLVFEFWPRGFIGLVELGFFLEELNPR
jgi:hypothetical protein